MTARCPGGRSVLGGVCICGLLLAEGLTAERCVGDPLVLPRGQVRRGEPWGRLVGDGWVGEHGQVRFEHNMAAFGGDLQGKVKNLLEVHLQQVQAGDVHRGAGPQGVTGLLVDTAVPAQLLGGDVQEQGRVLRLGVPAVQGEGGAVVCDVGIVFAQAPFQLGEQFLVGHRIRLGVGRHRWSVRLSPEQGSRTALVTGATSSPLTSRDDRNVVGRAARS